MFKDSRILHKLNSDHLFILQHKSPCFNIKLNSFIFKTRGFNSIMLMYSSLNLCNPMVITIAKIYSTLPKIILITLRPTTFNGFLYKLIISHMQTQNLTMSTTPYTKFHSLCIPTLSHNNDMPLLIISSS